MSFLLNNNFTNKATKRVEFAYFIIFIEIYKICELRSNPDNNIISITLVDFNFHSLLFSFPS